MTSSSKQVLRETELEKKQPFRILSEPGLRDSSLVVGWGDDAGRLGAGVIDYLRRQLGAQKFAEIEPLDFFSLGGVSVVNDIARFPRCDFYVCPESNLVLFKGSSPGADWYRFLSTILEIAQVHCNTKEVYIIGGMVSIGVHTAPRDIMAVANYPEMKALLSEYGLASDTDYESPPVQRPTLSSFLLWVAKKRNLHGIGLWVPIPFYLLSVEDPLGWKKVIEFLNVRFSLQLAFSDLDKEISTQSDKLSRLALRLPEIDQCFWKIERNLSLTEEENRKLIEEIEESLRKAE